jgi:hypothetical protein
MCGYLKVSIALVHLTMVKSRALPAQEEVKSLAKDFCSLEETLK